jgi:AAA lid domain
MEDHRDDVVVIAAGYHDEMLAFLDAYPGLGSRFSQHVGFEDYTPDQLVTIVEQHAAQAGYELDPGARAGLLAYFTGAPRGRSFGNGRFARRTLDAMITRQAGRISRLPAPTRDELRLLLPGDLQP